MRLPLALVLLALASPALAARAPRTPERLVWPAPPETARIEYVRELRGPKDIGASESALRRTLMALAGAKPSESVNLARPTDVFGDVDGRDTAEGELTPPERLDFERFAEKRRGPRTAAEIFEHPVDLGGDRDPA